MTEAPSPHFDAPRTSSVAGATMSALRDHWQTVVASIVTVAILQTMAFGLVGIDAIGSARVDASVASVSLFVAAETEATPAEVDALGPLIRAVPGVADATLRSKDDALKALIAGGLPPPDGRNPLPDVWIVRLKAGAADGGSVAAAWAAKRHSLASLPRVASVSADERWIATIDRGATRWRNGWPVALSVGLAVLALAAAAAAYLAGRGLLLPPSADKRVEMVGLRALAFAAVPVGSVTALISYAASWALVDRTAEAIFAGVAWPFGQLFATRPLFAASIALATIMILAAGLVLGHRRG